MRDRGVQCSAKIAMTRSSLLGKRRNSVASPTPARRAISAVEASSPRSAKPRRRGDDPLAVSGASARSARDLLLGRGHADIITGTGDPATRGTGTGSVGVDPRDVAAPQQGDGEHRAGRDQPGRDQNASWKPSTSAASAGPATARRRASERSRSRCWQGREDRETERAADLLRGVEHARGEPGVVGPDSVVATRVRGTNVSAHPDRDRQQAGEQRAVAAVDLGRRREQGARSRPARGR